ncbi:hypothetical protein FBY10_105298 [Pseudomonas sp. SJZ103]|uniref:hypothetical protein n=1 Tax=unclassified Pseudomonas TaxID=196821 RepID=UPI0011AC8452|nr:MULTISPECIES: hypothetical protein [unclassified Pseudomonas]TWC70248.1 hypothetical protein FBY10_105298 [Pseudomonas sp. SJZ103]TWC87342.1 hypothetical protein FBY08_10482 [Pseudomonas sp. SJZ094]
MNTKTLLMMALSCLAANTASAGTNTWTTGWAMGTTEYAVDDGNGNELVIACPSDDDRYVSASATVNGRGYSSEDGRGFDLIVDGKTFHNPFYTDCRACSSIFTHEFWGALRNANRLQFSAQGKVFNLPTENLKAVLPALNDENSSCLAAW